MLYDTNKNLLRKRVVRAGFFMEREIKVLRLSTLFDIPPSNTPWLIGLERAVVGFKPDIIIVHGVVGISSIRIARLRSRLATAKLIFDDHMTYNATRGSWTRILYGIFKKVFTPMLLKTVDFFVAAVSDETERFMEEVYGIPASRIVVIPLGVDRIIFHYDLEARHIIRSKYGIRDSDVIFQYVGKIIPEKGVHLLVSAGIELCKRHPNVKIMFVGGADRAYIEKIRERIGKSGFIDRFIFVEAVPNEQLCPYYSAADVGVWPLQCSISMVEAMSCSLPVIISDKSGTVERVSEETGLLYRECDVNDLRTKMEELLDKRLRKIMAKNAEKYTEKLDWEIVSKKFLELAFED
jgi:glycosyltransferase involved in cell wall biosynthesis